MTYDNSVRYSSLVRVMRPVVVRESKQLPESENECNSIIFLVIKLKMKIKRDTDDAQKIWYKNTKNEKILSRINKL